MEDNDWCLQIAKEVAPDAPAYARSLALVEDAAYFFRFQELRKEAKTECRAPSLSAAKTCP